MNKRIKWGIIILIGAGLAGLGIYQFTAQRKFLVVKF